MTEDIFPPPLPGILGEIEEIAGLEVALKIAEAKGGTRAYFPTKVGPDHWLANLIGQEWAQLLCSELVAASAGVAVEVPLGDVGEREKGRRELHRLLDAGWAASDIARHLKIDRRTVRRHKNGFCQCRKRLSRELTGA